ncbi:MAG: PQQ-binding-like beta-propeller repeat protein, partial [Bradymonadaceae bacterium]
MMYRVGSWFTACLSLLLLAGCTPERSRDGLIIVTTEPDAQWDTSVDAGPDVMSPDTVTTPDAVTTSDTVTPPETDGSTSPPDSSTDECDDLNACGRCGVPDALPGEPCGEVAGNVWACTDDDELECIQGDPSVGFPVADGNIRAMAVDDEYLYLGGNFSYLGPLTGQLGVFDRVDASPKAGWPRISGSVQDVIPDGEGGWYIGGCMSQVGSVQTHGLVRLRPDLSVIEDWIPTLERGCVRTLDLHEGTLYVGGSFLSINGEERTRVASFAHATGELTGFRADPEATLFSIAAGDGLLYMGGTFLRVNDTSRRYLAAVSLETGELTEWSPILSPTGGDTEIRGLVLGDDTIYVTGNFGSIDGVSGPNVAAFSRATGERTSWAPRPFSGSWYGEDLTIFGDTVYVVGFTSTGGGMRQGALAALPTATSEVSWTAQMGTETLTVAADAGAVYAGGIFITADGEPRSRVAAFSAETGALLSWDPGTNGTVRALAVTDDAVIVGGSFSSSGSGTRTRLARISRASGEVSSWNLAPSAWVTLLEMHEGTLYIGGGFDSIG